MKKPEPTLNEHLRKAHRWATFAVICAIISALLSIASIALRFYTLTHE